MAVGGAAGLGRVGRAGALHPGQPGGRGLRGRGGRTRRRGPVVNLLREDAALPPALRHWLKAFHSPHIEVHVGLSKPSVPGIRFADVLVIEQKPPAGQRPRVETFSFKSRHLAPLEGKELAAQITMDARAALDFYGGTVDILRRSIKGRFEVQHVRLVYEGGPLIPKHPQVLKEAVGTVKQDVKGVEVLVR